VRIADDRPCLVNDLVGGAAAVGDRQLFGVQHAIAQRVVVLLPVGHRRG
jgi:hypothetical protein